MLETPPRLSPVAGHLTPGRFGAVAAVPGVVLAERPGLAQVHVSLGDAAGATAVATALGFALPQTPNTTAAKGGTAALWLGPGKWLVVGPDAGLHATLAAALTGKTGAAVDQGHNRWCLRIAGPAARALMAKGCALDLHPRVFATGACAQSTWLGVSVLLHQAADGPVYDIYVARSFALHLWESITDAAAELGYEVRSA